MATMESPPSYQQQQRQRRQPPTKLQFLVLGAAGAGKTSILRRYFYKTFQDGSRLPTLGSDFYAGRVAYPGSTPTPTHTTEAGAGEGEDTEQSQQQQQQGVEIRLQMWDTPGRERFASKRRLRYETSLSDSFFRQADAIMLVYDMTNSTSFTQLLGWYADLVEMKHKMKEIGRVLPIMIVANKLDIFQSDKDRRRDAAPHYPQHDIDEQRDVLGLRGTFRGNDFRYEYRVSHVNSNAQTELRKSGGGSSGSSSSNRMEISSFLANRENWTTDGSYLDSVRTVPADGLDLLLPGQSTIILSTSMVVGWLIVIVVVIVDYSSVS
jgi:small GTP-binding protein